MTNRTSIWPQRPKIRAVGAILTTALAASLAGSCLAAAPRDACTAEPDDRQRLACYDSLFGASPAASIPEPGNPKVASEPITPGAPVSLMSKMWELHENDRRESFVVRTYLPNFLLPLHYTTSINRSPSSPTQPAGPASSDYRQIEAKLQISLRAKVIEDLFLPGANLWVAYTQRSLWQIWDSADSAPFRSTDYQPEAIYVLPVPANIGELPFGWSLRMLQFGFAHQSNGQQDPLSRSWNRTYIGAGLEHGNFGVMLRANHRLPENNKDDNPDLTSYIGQGEIAMNWFAGSATVNLAWRPNFHAIDRGSVQLDWTYPVFANQPAGLRWYAQLFSGFGETLLDYNHRQTSLGVGLTLFQF